MGVHGLWRLIEPSGKPVPLETLENKILAVDVSIWLHQAVKGFQDARGASLPNAHLLGIYHRLCKLLYFRIKPVFIFDGGVPVLKKQTIAKRSQHSSKIRNDATSIQQKILSTLLKHSAIQKVINENDGTSTTTNTIPTKTNTKDDMFALPDALPASDLDSTIDSDYSDTETSDSSPTKQWDLHTIDEKSPHFTSLPAEVRHDILTDLKEQRKQSSWGRLHELPKQSGDFSSFQMKRLLKRYSVQVCLEEATKEMGGHTLSLNELEALLTEEGIVTASKNSTRRIASDENKSYLLIKDVKKAMEQAKIDEQKAKELEMNADKIKPESSIDTKSEPNKIDEKDSEYERDLKAAIELSLQDTPSTSKDAQNYDYLDSLNDGDFMSESSDSDDCTKDSKYVLSAAESYMLEFSDLTPHEIANIVSKNDKKGTKSSKKKSKLSKILEIAEEADSSIEIDDKTDIKVETDKSNDNKIELDDKLLDLKSETVEIMSDSDGSDFVEVEQKDLTSKIDSKSNKEMNEIDEYDDDLKAAIVLSLQANIEPDVIKSDDSNHPKSETSQNLLKNDIKNETPNAFSIKSSIEINKSPETTMESIDIVTENETIEAMSDSDDSDFVEVEEPTSTAPQKPAFEVVIKPITKIEDDLFGDIFAAPIPKTTEVEFKKPLPVPKEAQISKVKPDSTVIETKETPKKIESVNKVEESNEVTVVSKDLPKKVKDNKPKLTMEELNKLKTDLIKDQQELIAERNSKERMAGDITNQMYLEAQELLELFGCPYIVAPMEAEAQCAFLNLINLTDGTITDDSDIWLFGGQTVYKNFFNQKKHVMEYRAERIKQCFKLSREQMILLALLVGSDYTLGIQGIGPVTALEILAAFPPAKNVEISLTQSELISGLSEFKHWLTDGRILGPGRTALRSKLQNISITDGFPSLSVVQAYLQPEVETCRDAFSWGKPDFVGLIDYAREKFGWTRLKTEEILKPVIKKLEDLSKQKSIRDFFATKHKVELDLLENKMSKRVKMAINKMGKSKEQLCKDEKESENIKKGSKRKVNLKKLKDKQTVKDNDVQISEDLIGFDEPFDLEEPTISSEVKKVKQVNDESQKPKKGTRKASNPDKQVKEKPLKSESKPRGRRPRNDNPENKSRAQRKRKIDLHEEDPIPQRETDKINALKTKLRAIEVFRKSQIDQKAGKRKPARKPKDEAELSESSDSS